MEWLKPDATYDIQIELDGWRSVSLTATTDADHYVQETMLEKAQESPHRAKKEIGDTPSPISFSAPASAGALVEARGVEPLSENTSLGTSPGADGYFHSLARA